MKVRLNKKVYADMPEQVRAIVKDWQQHYKKATISIEDTRLLYIAEDAKYTLINLQTGVQQSARAEGEWAGSQQLSCNTYLELPKGVVAIEKNFFLGTPYLTIFQGAFQEEYKSPNRLNW